MTAIAQGSARRCVDRAFRRSLVFAIVYAIIYATARCRTGRCSPITPRIGRIRTCGPASRRNGPAMYWYGWIDHLGGGRRAVIGRNRGYLPDNLTRKMPAASPGWCRCLAMVTAAGLMINMYFRR